MSTYSAWWREIGASEWNAVHSESPISWTQGIEQGQCLGRYRGVITYYNDFFQWVRNRTTAWLAGPITEYSFTYISTVVISGYPREYWDLRLRNASGATVVRRCNLHPSRQYTVFPLQPENFVDDCGDCITTFSTGLVVKRPQCIEVALIPPECPCCGDMLPVATRILNRLQGMIA